MRIQLDQNYRRKFVKKILVIQTLIFRKSMHRLDAHHFRGVYAICTLNSKQSRNYGRFNTI